MNAIITKIDPEKLSRNGNSFIRVYFRGADGQFLITDLCKSYRNWKNWYNLLEAGNTLGNLTKRNERSITADSRPFLISRKIEQPSLL